MADPISLTALAVGSGLLSGAAAISAGNTQEGIAKANAQTLRVNAGTALNSSEAEGARIQRNTSRTVAAGENASGASGLQMVGSPLDLMGDMSAEGALDAQIARWRGVASANSGLTQAGQMIQQGAAAREAGYIGAGTTFLQTGLNIANQRAFMAGLSGRQG